MSSEELKKKLQDSYANWEKNSFNKTVSKFPERLRNFTTQSFTEVKPLYTPLDINNESHDKKIGYP